MCFAVAHQVVNLYVPFCTLNYVTMTSFAIISYNHTGTSGTNKPFWKHGRKLWKHTCKLQSIVNCDFFSWNERSSPKRRLKNTQFHFCKIVIVCYITIAANCNSVTYSHGQKFLESKKALFYIFDSTEYICTRSVFANSKKLTYMSWLIAGNCSVLQSFSIPMLAEKFSVRQFYLVLVYWW